jgi:hypothetical protein
MIASSHPHQKPEPRECYDDFVALAIGLDCSDCAASPVDYCESAGEHRAEPNRFHSFQSTVVITKIKTSIQAYRLTSNFG